MRETVHKTLTMSSKDSHRSFLKLLTLLINFLEVSAQDFAREEELPSCQLPSGKAAVCVAISQCGHLTSLIGNLQQPLPRDVGLLIRDLFWMVWCRL